MNIFKGKLQNCVVEASPPILIVQTLWSMQMNKPQKEKKILYATDYRPKRKSPILLDFANYLNRTKPSSKNAIIYDDPEYYVMENIVTDDMAKIGMFLQIRNPQSAKDIAPKSGTTEEEAEKLLWELAKVGCCFVNTIDGLNKYWTEIWVPGTMEMITNNRELVSKHPEIAIAFDAYGKKKGGLAAGIIPMGVAPMRVIPIESAIESDSRHASYEEISKYLNENTIFSVSDCACRTVREKMGEGCGHLKEEMCIQMGHAAEYYIKTGRARQITREEAFAIIKKAEENGLMHDIPNLDGEGKTHAICNCCGCGCLAIRNATMYRNPDFSRSNYVAVIDEEKCVACGECVEHCPVNALKLGQKICSHTPIPEEKTTKTPRNSRWTPEDWNPDYRTNRKVAVKTGTSPCKANCPAHIGVQGYIKLAAQGKYREALELIKIENPFPAVCGHVCPRYCEQGCSRLELDEAVAVDDIKKFIAQKDLESEYRYIPTKHHDYHDKKIAIIGAGPAGLSCAYYLALDNYDVTVFEKENSLGGMLKFGIPSFRLEKNVIDAEIDVLKELGVQFKTGVEVGKDVTLDELRSQEFKAFYLAIGAQKGRKLGIEGEDLEGVTTGVDFLREENLHETKQLSGNVVVIGGGNVAIDVARMAVRAGGEKVQLFCLESLNEMPALPEEIHEAQSEGISIQNSWGPKRIIGENGKVTAIEFKKCTSVFDADHRFNPKYDENETITIQCDFVITSVGQAIDLGKILENSSAEINRNQTVKADPITYQSGQKDIFVGGDVLTGPKFAIDAIAQGKEGAISIHRFVQPGQSLVLGRLKRDYRPLDRSNLDLEGFDRLPRQSSTEPSSEMSKKTFRNLRGDLTEEQVKKETQRCLKCGVTKIDEFMCIGCGMCTTRCRFGAIRLERVYDAHPSTLKDIKKVVIKNVVKREARLLFNKIFKPNK